MSATRPAGAGEASFRLIEPTLYTARRGLTREHLPKLADLNPRTVQKIEAGAITILVTTLHRLRAALHCEWRRLLG